MLLSRRRTDTRLSAIVWGMACDMRRSLDGWAVKSWPTDGLTAKEENLLAEANGFLDAAADRVRRVQGSVSARCKDAVVENPDFSFRDR